MKCAVIARHRAEYPLTLMCRVLGMPDYKFAVIGHPISSAPDSQLQDFARATIEQARTLLIAR